jgi:hypothetical protein
MVEDAGDTQRWAAQVDDSLWVRPNWQRQAANTRTNTSANTRRGQSRVDQHATRQPVRSQRRSPSRRAKETRTADRCGRPEQLRPHLSVPRGVPPTPSAVTSPQVSASRRQCPACKPTTRHLAKPAAHQRAPEPTVCPGLADYGNPQEAGTILRSTGTSPRSAPFEPLMPSRRWSVTSHAPTVLSLAAIPSPTRNRVR